VAKASPNNTAAADKLDIEPRSNNWRQACQRRTARILRFADRQKKQREWIQFSELAERYGRNIGIAEGYEQLKRAVIAGEFERDGRSRVLYLHPAVTAAKMTREKMRNAVETFPAETVRRHYLAPCWIPRELADAWWVIHGPQALNEAETTLPSDPAAKGKRGRKEYDDAVALEEMYPLVIQQGLSHREAAKQVVAHGLARGTGTTESTIDRVRIKFAAQASQK